MKNYILFLHGSFSSKEQILNFIENRLNNNIIFKNKKYIIEKEVNLIFLFSSDLSQENLSYKLKDNLKDSEISFYFLFDINSVVTATVQPELIDYIQKGEINKYFEIIYELDGSVNNKISDNKPNFDEDEILDKIFNNGIESLTDAETNFLKNKK
jgi:hypothetical protein